MFIKKSMDILLRTFAASVVSAFAVRLAVWESGGNKKSGDSMC